MREEPDLRAVEVLLAALAWFAGPYRALADDVGEDLTTQVVFNELAEVTSRLLLGAGEHEELVEAIFAAVEQVALGTRRRCDGGRRLRLPRRARTWGARTRRGVPQPGDRGPPRTPRRR